MMKLVPPKPLFYHGGDKAVLLLHSFTSSTIDMKKLGRCLQKNGYSYYAPLYSGHGLGAEELLHYRASDWWEDALKGYQLLKNEGFEEIAVIGLSLGGVLALKVAQELQVNGVVTMSVPKQREALFLQKRVFHYAKGYKQLEGKNEEQIEVELNNLQKLPIDSLVEFQQLIDQTMTTLAKIKSPIRVLYGELDEPLYKESAEMIVSSVSSKQKSINGYPNSKHLMTLGKDSEDLNLDIMQFLNSLVWSKSEGE